MLLEACSGLKCGKYAGIKAFFADKHVVCADTCSECADSTRLWVDTIGRCADSIYFYADMRDSAADSSV